MSAIFERCATENIDSIVKSVDEAMFERFWLLSSENSNIFEESADVVISEFSMNTSLDRDVDEAEVRADEMKFSSFDKNCFRASKIRSTRSAEITSDENFSESDSLKSEKLLTEKFLEVSLKCLETKLNDRLKIFS